MRHTARIVLLAVSGIVAPWNAAAHPGSGLEVDAHGNVYVSDIFRTTIWRIDKDGEPHPHVEDAWSHEFHLDAHGRLVYEKEHDGQPSPQSAWVAHEDGTRTNIIEATRDDSTFGGTAFARDADGSVYFAFNLRGEGNRWYAVIRKRDAADTRGKSVRTWAGATEGDLYHDGPKGDATFRMVTDMRFDKGGALWLLDRDRVRVVSAEGVVTTHGPALIEEDPRNPPFRSGPVTTWNRLYGLALDGKGGAYVGYFAGRRVDHIASDGVVSDAYTSSRGWAPVGVAVDGDGRLHVSEASDRGRKIRVVRVDGEGGGEVLALLGG